MSLADDLAKLEDLRRTGALTESEFAKAKAAVLAGGSSPAPADGALADNMAAQLAEVRYQNELERIDREWGIEKEKYMVTGQHGRRDVPTTGAGIGTAIVVGVFGVFWTVMAISITSGGPDFGPDFGPPPIVRIFFPLFGVAFTIGGIWKGVHVYNQAEAYNRALEAYKRRRASVRSEDFR